MRHLDDLVNADARGQLHRRNVARLGEGCGQCHRPLEVVLVVVRRIAAKAYRRIDDDVGGLGALFNSRGVDVGLETGAGLALGLCGAVELRQREVAPADHGEDVAAGVVHGEERALRAGVLLEGGAPRGCPRGVGQMDIDNVAGLDECVAATLAGPLPVGRQQYELRRRRSARVISSGWHAVTTAWT